MILFFSGTGNSRYAARRLAEALDAEPAVSINEYLKAAARVILLRTRPMCLLRPHTLGSFRVWFGISSARPVFAAARMPTLC